MASDKTDLLKKLTKEEQDWVESQPKPSRCTAYVISAVFGFPEKEYRCNKEYGHEGGHHWSAFEKRRNKELRLSWETEEV
jgi:hypothetical protein